MTTKLPTMLAFASSMFTEAGHDDSDIFVRFNNNKVYRYINAAVRFDEMQAAPSAGVFINTVLKPHYVAQLVED